MKIIADKNIRYLILGTYPGKKSIEADEYYFDKGNQFWSLLGIDKKLDFDKKKEELRRLKIGLWDVFKSIDRAGSSDSKIKGGVINDISILKRDYKKIEVIFFNGQTAEKYGDYEIKKLGIQTKRLLSSSGANNRKSEERRKQWTDLF